MNQDRIELTKEQHNVIDNKGTVFVTACPGAGKTRVIVESARRLFQAMPSGRGIAFVSFTQAAVSELETRLRQEGLLSKPFFPSFIGTFDSFVWQFLVAPFGINDCKVRPRLIVDAERCKVRPYTNAQPLTLSCFNRQTGAMIEHAARLEGFEVARKPKRLVMAYTSAAMQLRARMRERGQLSFDEARAVALERLKDLKLADSIAAALKGRLLRVVIDEAQDCNPDDLEILKWLRNARLPLQVVCDPHQSIYGFRGGVTDHLLEFADSFPAEQRLVLSGNFRSNPNICKAVVQLRPPTKRGTPDEALGPLKNDTTPIHILSYTGAKVPETIGAQFVKLLDEVAINVSAAPIVAATKMSAAAAVGQPYTNNSKHRIIRLAKAVTDFHFASGFSDLKQAVEGVHEVVLELEGHLNGVTYHQYLSDNEIEPASWRSKIVALIRLLRFDPAVYKDATAWHKAAKDALSKNLVERDGKSIAQKLRFDKGLGDVLVAAPSGTPMQRTIHSVKGMEYPAVCLVTTASTLTSILSFLETGAPDDRAEEARKLYVAASRAKQLLVIAAPASQSERLKAHLGGSSAEVSIRKI